MPYSLHEIRPEDRAIFSSITSTVWKAHHQPYQPYFGVYNPVFGPTNEDRQRALEASTDRRWKAHLADPSSHWVYVVDDDNPNTVVGTCQWKFYAQNPYPDVGAGGKMPYDASMWPEGSVGRQFAEAMLWKQYAHRIRWLRRKHAVCHDMSVLPSHRRHGIGSLLMSWGMKRADELSSEIFFHGSEQGRQLYEKWGMRVVQKIDLDMTVTNPSDEWERMRHDFGPLRIFLMWKPHGGVYEEGVTKLPWEAGE